MLRDFEKNKNELGTNKAQLNLTQHVETSHAPSRLRRAPHGHIPRLLPTAHATSPCPAMTQAMDLDRVLQVY
jgi:hypothetical protein